MNQLLTLMGANEPQDSTKDPLDPRRRLELRSPDVAKEVLEALKNPVPDTALKLFEIVERDLKSKRPDLAWDAVELVRGWIRETAGKGC